MKERKGNQEAFGKSRGNESVKRREVKCRGGACGCLGGGEGMKVRG
jgi:hypothetical protein